jgi:caffeoyl-CoA O-methyltransferase
MKRTLLVALIVVAVAAAAFAQRRAPGPPGRGGYMDPANPPLPKSEGEKRIIDTQQKMVEAGEMYLNVPMNDGRMLRILTETVGAKSVVELGTSTGYSGLWFCTALQNTGGKLTTFEIDPGRAATARKALPAGGRGQPGHHRGRRRAPERAETERPH